MPRGKKTEDGIDVEEAVKDESNNYGFSEKYSLDPQAEQIARLVVEQYPNELGHVNVDSLGFVRKDCKASEGNKKKFANYRPIKQPTKAFCSKTGVIVTVGDNYRMLPLNIRQRVIFHELLHVLPNGEEGAYDHDVEDFAYCVDTWGSKWVFNIEAPMLVEMEETVESINDTMPVDEE